MTALMSWGARIFQTPGSGHLFRVRRLAKLGSGMTFLTVLVSGCGAPEERPATPPALRGDSPASTEAGRFHRAFDLANWDDGGELSRFVYRHPSQFFPTAVLPRQGPVAELSYDLDPRIGNYEMTLRDGGTTLDEFVTNSSLDGLIIVHRGRIVYEAYPRMRPQDRHMLFSVTKAFVGTAVGILEDRGLVDLGRGVETYVPELQGTAWAGIAVRDLLEMASGMEGSESTGRPFEDPDHKFYQLEASLGWQPLTSGLPTAVRSGETYEYLKSLRRIEEPGKRWLYTSANSAVLGWLLESVTGESLAKTLTQEIWSRLGAESDALLMLNDNGVPIAHAGLAMTLRDLARFGLLFTDSWEAVGDEPVLSDGLLRRIQEGGRPELLAWLPESAGWTLAGEPDWPHHVAYHWDGVTDEGALFKFGFAGQLLVIFPAEEVVIAYFSTNEAPAVEPEDLLVLPVVKLVADLFDP